MSNPFGGPIWDMNLPHRVRVQKKIKGGRGRRPCGTDRLSRRDPQSAALSTKRGSRGDLDAAIESFRRALALKPDLAGAHNNLGNVQRDLGDLQEAGDSY